MYENDIKDTFTIMEINYSNFTTTEKEIANFFLKNDQIIDFSSKNIAQLLYTSEASLSRFAKKCGFKGFRQFSFWYQENLSHRQEQNLEDHTKLTLNTYQELLNKSYSLINEEQIKRAAKMICQKKRIFVYGKGFSGVAARELMLRLICIGIHTECITDTHLMVMNSALIDSNSLVIGISVSGKSNEIFYALKKAKVQEAATIAISSIHIKHWDEFCDEVLLISTKENLTLGKLISPQFPILVLFDILYSSILQYNQSGKQIYPEIMLAELNSIAANPNYY